MESTLATSLVNPLVFSIVKATPNSSLLICSEVHKDSPHFSVEEPYNSTVSTNGQEEVLAKLFAEIEISGFIVFNKEVFDYIKPGSEIEKVFVELVKTGQVAMFRHDRFFHAMDTYKDYLELNKMWESNQAPWKIWE